MRFTTRFAPVSMREASFPEISTSAVMGIAAGVLVTMGAAGFGLTGRVIAPLALAFFAALNAAVLWRRRPGLREYKEAWPLWLMGLAALGVVCWPLLVAGYRDYWGYANPDHSFYLEVFQHLHDNPFGMRLTTLMVTHNMNQALHLGNRLIMMHRGEVILDVAGAVKRELTVENLLSRFYELKGEREETGAGNRTVAPDKKGPSRRFSKSRRRILAAGKKL